MILTTLQVKAKSSQYPLYIGRDLLLNSELLRKSVKSNQVLVVTDAKIMQQYEPMLRRAFEGMSYQVCELPPGEGAKCWSSISTIIDRLMANQYRRDCTLVALGGGVIGDITGFAAAIYQRGVGYIQVPTTLLAQVDASVGGKTAINHPQGKNMIGAFHQPAAVFCDINTLKTLPPREFSCGLAEVIKAAMIADATFFEWLEQHVPKILARDGQVLTTMIGRACQIKINIVEEDEFEVTGKRSHLNFGHTFGHAIECLQGYASYQHGEAVAIGMVMATNISVALGKVDKKITIRLKKLLTSVGLPIKLNTDLQELELAQQAFLDKKNQEYGLTLVLLNALGSATLYRNVKSVELRELMTVHGSLGVS